MDPLHELSRLAGTSVSGLGLSGDRVLRNRSLHERPTPTYTATNTNCAPSTIPHRPTVNLFVQDLPTLSTQTARENKEEMSRFRTPEERVDDHLDRVVNRITETQEGEMRRMTDDLYEKRAKEMHKARMAKYVAELHGNRTLGGSSNNYMALGQTTLPMPVNNGTWLDRAQVSPYVEIVHNWNRTPQAPLDQVLSAFQSLAMTAADSFAWKLLAAIVSSQRCTGALSFYCRQFQQIVNSRVREATAAGQDTSMPYVFSNGMAKMVASYVRLTTNVTSSIWPIVYVCLRCGDAVAALNVLQTTPTQVEACVVNIVASLAQTQGNSPCIWDPATPLAVQTKDRQAAVALCDRMQHQDSNNGDPYHLACLAFLSLKDSDSILSSPTIKTVEDYMFAGLWYALQQPYPKGAIAELGNSIKELGATSFPSESEWGYALPLMAAQQYQSAFNHIARSNLLQATHMAMILHKADIGLVDTPSVAEQKPCLFTTLLFEFARKLQEKNPIDAIEYLVRIPNQRRAQTEVALLVVESQQLCELDVPIEALFQENSTLVFVHAAELARSRGSADVAAHLFFRAGRYDLLLALLNNQLASEMVGDNQTAEWRTKALQFHAEYLGSGMDGRVVRLLEENGTEGRLETFQILMDLYNAFESCKMKDFERAWTTIDGLPLLPSTEAECTMKAQQFASLDPSLKKVLPLVLVTAMECISQIYARLKSSSFGPSATQEQERLRSRASLLLFDFAGMLQREIPADAFARMTLLEKGMM